MVHHINLPPSRLEHPSDFNRHQARFDFYDEYIEYAYEELQGEIDGADASPISDSRCSITEGSAPKSPRLHIQEVPWMSLEDPDELTPRLSSDSGNTNQRHSRSSSEIPASSRSPSSAAAAAAASRSRTSSAPEVIQHSRDSLVACNPINNYDADCSFVRPDGPCASHKSSPNFIIINSPDAEQTVPYASRIVRFFSGVKGPED